MPIDLKAYLSGKTYPGRGIVLGRSRDGKKAVVVYFIMGRSVNSRNRVFVHTDDGIRTQAHDPGKMVDPSLIIYHPVRIMDQGTVVTNGDQTDTIRNGLLAGKTFADALRTRTFEPDGPNWTPRISGLLAPDGSYKLSILKSLEGDPACCCRYFFEYASPQAGMGHIIHTYAADGEPLPSYAGEPAPVAIDALDPQSLSEQVWASLNEDNKVSLYVSYIDLATGQRDTTIVNKHPTNALDKEGEQ